MFQIIRLELYLFWQNVLEKKTVEQIKFVEKIFVSTKELLELNYFRTNVIKKVVLKSCQNKS